MSQWKSSLSKGAAGPLVICPDAGMAAELAALLARRLPGPSPTVLKTYPSTGVLAHMLNSTGTQLCFLDAATNREVAFQLLSELGELNSGVVVVALLAGNDPDVILRCLRQGASEFLIRPFTPDQLLAALQKLSRLRPVTRPAAASQCRLYCLMPAKGACGATTLACNLAFHLPRFAPGRLLLADMDPLTGTLAFLLKLKSSYSFLDALTRAANLDADLWKSLVTPCQGVEVLLSPENPADAIAETGDPSPLLRFIRQLYKSMVLDVGGAYGDWNLALADQSDEVVLVTTNELPALHATQRALAYLEANGIAHSKIRLVVDRFRPDLGLPQDQIETALHSEVFQALPSDNEAIQKALLEGKPALPGTKFAKSVATLAEKLAQNDGSPKRAPSAGRFNSLVR